MSCGVPNPFEKYNEGRRQKEAAPVNMILPGRTEWFRSRCTTGAVKR